MNPQVKEAYANARDAFLLRLIQSPGTTLGGAMLSAGSIIAFLGTPKAAHWAQLLIALGGGLVGLNATSHGFVSKQGTNTQTFNKPDGMNLNTVGSIPPTPPAPPKL